MQWQDIPVALAVVGALGGGAKFYGDNTYLLVADSLEGQLFQLKRDIKRMELEDGLTPKEEAYLEFLQEQAEELEQKLD